MSDKHKAPVERPLSPFMIGPYYKPQLSSMLSIAHRLSGVFLSLFGSALLIYWVTALSLGPVAYFDAMQRIRSVPGVILLALLCFALYYHFFNGLRHLVWDSGRMLDMKSANRAGILVLLLAVLATGLTSAKLGGLL